jgi:hypothetical protein
MLPYHCHLSLRNNQGSHTSILMIMEAVEAAVLYEALEASARTKQDPAKPPEPNNGQQTEGSVASATTANTQG